MRRAGIELELRPLELATLFSDVTRGNFQITYQRWVGANTDPIFLKMLLLQAIFPPNGATVDATHPRLDALTDQIRMEMIRKSEKLFAAKHKKSGGRPSLSTLVV